MREHNRAVQFAITSLTLAFNQIAENRHVRSRNPRAGLELEDRAAVVQTVQVLLLNKRGKLVRAAKVNRFSSCRASRRGKMGHLTSETLAPRAYETSPTEDGLPIRFSLGWLANRTIITE